MGAARHERHSLLEHKCRELGIPSLMTAHHAGRDWRIHVLMQRAASACGKHAAPNLSHFAVFATFCFSPHSLLGSPLGSQVFKQSVARFYG